MFAGSYDLHNVNECDDTQRCNFTATFPTDMPTPPYGYRSVQATFGSRFPLTAYDPTNGTTNRTTIDRFGGHGGNGPSPAWALSPVYDTEAHTLHPAMGSQQYGIDEFDCSDDDTEMSTYGRPNQFDTVTIQGIYQDGMWIDEAEKAGNFAKRSIFMTGTSSAAIANLDSGENNTMPDNLADSGKFQHAKYAVGTLPQGILTKGGRVVVQSSNDGYDILMAVGAANLGTLAFDSSSDGTFYDVLHRPAAGTATPPLYATVRGSDNFASINGRISESDSDGKMVSGAGARAIHGHESDKWNPGVAMVNQMLGAAGTTLFDMKEDDSIDFYDPTNGTMTVGGPPTIPSGWGAHPGYISSAVCFQATSGAAVTGSYFNVNEARGFSADLSLLEFYDKLDTGCGSSERCDSVIRDYQDNDLGYSPGQLHTCSPPHILNSVGVFVGDKMPNSGGGSRIQNPDLVKGTYYPDSLASIAAQPERRASIISNGNVVLGDGTDSSTEYEKNGYSTDVVHIHDLLHLAPRTSPPEIADNVPASDRAGLVYADARKGTLRVSVPFRGSGIAGSTNWKADGIAWVDVKLNTENIKPEDIVLNDSDSSTAAQLYDTVNHPDDGGPAYQEFVANGLQHARDEATVEPVTSPYIAPSVCILSHDDPDGGMVTASIRVSGMRRAYAAGSEPNPPEIYYQTRIHRTPTIPYKSPWTTAQVVTRLSSPPQGVHANLGDAFFLVSCDLGGEFVVGEVYLMAIEPENQQCSGASFTIFKQEQH